MNWARAFGCEKLWADITSDLLGSRDVEYNGPAASDRLHPYLFCTYMERFKINRTFWCTWWPDACLFFESLLFWLSRSQTLRMQGFCSLIGLSYSHFCNYIVVLAHDVQRGGLVTFRLYNSHCLKRLLWQVRAQDIRQTVNGNSRGVEPLFKRSLIVLLACTADTRVWPLYGLQWLGKFDVCSNENLWAYFGHRPKLPPLCPSSKGTNFRWNIMNHKCGAKVFRDIRHTRSIYIWYTPLRQ